MQLVVRYQYSENGRPIYSGTTCYNRSVGVSAAEACRDDVSH